MSFASGKVFICGLPAEAWVNGALLPEYANTPEGRAALEAFTTKRVGKVKGTSGKASDGRPPRTKSELAKSQQEQSQKYSKPGLPITNRAFLEAAFEHMAPNEYAATTSFGGDPHTVPQSAWSARAWRHGQHVPGSIMGRAQNTYLAVSSFTIGADGRFHRRKEDFAEMHLVMLDDVYTKIGRRKLKLPVSAMIETSPGNAQAFYFLRQSPESRNRAMCEGLVDAMIESGLTADGADPGMKGCNRLGRLPNGVNAKAKNVERLGHAFKCRLTAWHPERRYTIPEIAKAFKLDISTHSKKRAPGSYTPSRNKLPRGEATKRVNEFERMMKVLADEGLYLAARGSWHDVICPWVDEHTDAKVGGSALYSPAATNDWLGGFKCHHGHCENRTVGDVYKFVRHLVRGAT